MPDLPAPDAHSLAASELLALSLFDGAGLLAGTPSATWLARDRTSKTGVIVKRLSAATAKARVTQTLSLAHPGVVRTRRWLSVGGFVYAVRDVVRGRNLAQELASINNRHGAELLERLILPVLAALEAAHGAGIAHGGVSANNVLIAEDGRVLVSDFALCDPASKEHAPVYGGAATIAGDIAATGKLIARFLPTGGAFAQKAVRERVAGVLSRCDSLAKLRDTVIALDTLAASPAPRAAPGVPPPVIVRVGPPPMPEIDDAETDTAPPVTIDEPASRPADWVKTKPVAATPDPPIKKGVARLAWRDGTEGGVRVVTGGGGPATLILQNDGDAPVLVRMVATQRPWLQVRPMELPIRLPGGATVSLPFSVAARTLSPGEYRSEVYLSASTPETAASGAVPAEELKGGWFKHTAQIRVVVVPTSDTAPVPSERRNAAPDGKPPYPANAPRIPAPPGCAVFLLLLVPGIVSALWLGLRLGN